MKYVREVFFTKAARLLGRAFFVVSHFCDDKNDDDDDEST